MTKYLISFPSAAMVLTDEEFPIVSAEAHAVIEEAKAAGVYVFGGGIEEQVDPVLRLGVGQVPVIGHGLAAMQEAMRRLRATSDCRDVLIGVAPGNEAAE